MAILGNVPRPAYVYDTETDTWVPIGVGAHTHDTLYVNQNVIDAKGDLLVGTADNAYSRLGKGADGTVLVADNSTSTGLAWQPYGGIQVAGKNKVINGDFSIWQRGTSFGLGIGTTYHADRWRSYRDGSGATLTVTREAFTPGAAPVAGYDAQYYIRWNKSVAGSGETFSALQQPIEDVRTLAGQTVTVSFWAKADTNRNLGFGTYQVFGTGGSSVNYTGPGGQANLTTSWQRFSATATLASMSGKTIGPNSHLVVNFDPPMNTTAVIDIWGVQLEAGPIATPFTTATGTIQGELAACQRYYYRNTANSTDIYAYFGSGFTNATTNARLLINIPVTMRVKPTSVDFANLGIQENFSGNIYAISAISIGPDGGGPNPVYINATCATAVGTRQAVIMSNGSSSGYLGFSAEL
jgi:hypothetical protein